MRDLEKTIYTDLEKRQNYSAYLRLETLRACQEPLSDPPHHDEMLFIIQHQVAELWMKLVIHELEGAMTALREDRIGQAAKSLARIKHIQKQLYNQWSVLETLTPSEYAEFRHVFGDASGFQSPQYRMLEILLGTRNRDLLAVYRHLPAWHARLEAAISAPGVFDEFLRYLARRGFAIPPGVVERDFSVTRDVDPAVVGVLKRVYEAPDAHWGVYEICEALVDIANNFQFWRFRHMKTVERIIGHRRGTGGSSGVSFLKRAMDQEFFEELIAVRTEIHRDPPRHE